MGSKELTNSLFLEGHSKDDSATPDVSHSDRLEDHHARVGSVSGAVLAHAEGEPHSGLPRTNKPRTEIADFNKGKTTLPDAKNDSLTKNVGDGISSFSELEEGQLGGKSSMNHHLNLKL